MSGYVVGGLPFFLALFIFLAAPTFFDPMFESPPDVLGIPLGVILFGIAALAMGAGFYLIQKIVDIEV
jgi:Flp pilus assembly protein TadB